MRRTKAGSPPPSQEALSPKSRKRLILSAKKRTPFAKKKPVLPEDTEDNSLEANAKRVLRKHFKKHQKQDIYDHFVGKVNLFNAIITLQKTLLKDKKKRILGRHVADLKQKYPATVARNEPQPLHIAAPEECSLYGYFLIFKTPCPLRVCSDAERRMRDIYVSKVPQQHTNIHLYTQLHTYIHICIDLCRRIAAYMLICIERR